MASSFSPHGRAGSRRGGGCGENLLVVTSFSPTPLALEGECRRSVPVCAERQTTPSRDRHRMGLTHGPYGAWVNLTEPDTHEPTQINRLG